MVIVRSQRRRDAVIMSRIFERAGEIVRRMRDADGMTGH